MNDELLKIENFLSKIKNNSKKVPKKVLEEKKSLIKKLLSEIKSEIQEK